MSNSLILQGLDPYITKAELNAFLLSIDADLQDLRMPIDKTTGNNKGFAFAEFISTHHCETFLLANKPYITINSYRVRISFSQENELQHHLANNKHADDWICMQCNINNFSHRDLCFQCTTPKPEAPIPDGFVNDGSRDSGEIPNRLLLIRGLDRLYTLDQTQVRLILDRTDNQPWGFGFLEYADVGSAAQTLQLALSKPIFLNTGGSGGKLEVSYSHMQSFYDDYTPKSYHSIVTTAPSVVLEAKEVGDGDEKNGGDEVVVDDGGWDLIRCWSKEGVPFTKIYWDVKAYTHVYPVIIEERPVIVKKEKKRKRRDRDRGEEDQVAAFLNQVEEDNRGLIGTESLDDEARKKKKINPQLQKWQNKHQELNNPSNDPSNEEVTTTTNVSNNSNNIFQMTDEQVMQLLPSVEEVNVKYTERNRFFCLLCKRKFEGGEGLKIHLEKSKLHQLNLDLHYKKLIELKKSQLGTATKVYNKTGNGYRNRAAERRKLNLNNSGTKIEKKKVERIEVASVNESIKSDNIGSRMLMKMGWKEGTGLGVGRKGIVEPIKPKVYKKGQGL